MKKIFFITVLVGFFYCSSQFKIKKDMTALEKFDVCKEMIKHKKYSKAALELSKLRYQLMGTDHAVEVVFQLAQAYRMNKDYPEALVNYQTITRDYPNSSYSAISQYYSGICYNEMSLKAELDQEYTEKSKTSFQDLLDLFPENEYQDSAKTMIKEVNNKLAKKAFLNGKTYYKLHQYKSAEIYFQDVILNYFQTEWIDDSFYYLALTYLKLDKNEDAKLILQRIISEYTDTKYYKKAKNKLKEVNG